MSKLTKEQIVAMIEDYKTMGFKSLGKKYGVRPASVRHHVVKAGIALIDRTPVKTARTAFKVCGDCGRKLPSGVYRTDSSKGDGLQSRCPKCHGIRHYFNRIRQTYGLTREAWNNLWDQQNGACAVCGKPLPHPPDKSVSIDHCHNTGVVRGILCLQCNTGLGHMRDSPDILDAAKAYLARTPDPEPDRPAESQPRRMPPKFKPPGAALSKAPMFVLCRQCEGFIDPPDEPSPRGWCPPCEQAHQSDKSPMPDLTWPEE